MNTEKLFAALLLAAALLMPGQAAAARDGIIGSPEELQKIQVGKTTSAQLTEIAGKPIRLQRFPRQGTEYWTYSMQSGGRLVEIGIEIDDKGIVRIVEQVKKWGF